ncbi:GFA family protein [Sphingobium phenoxybenzoativorans]|uniref:GFA family protein n=1 Tax=Sphingobium phenoxybenzoativorans TaxID=1592790 RepID=UPI0009F5CE3E
MGSVQDREGAGAKLSRSEASCVCGELRVTLKGPPSVVSSCCCRHCQRRRGSLVAVQAFYDVEQLVTVMGLSQTFMRSGDSGANVTFHFCARCGTTLHWFPEFRPGKVAVAVGAFADKSFPVPERLVWSEFRHPWVQVPPGTTEYSGNAPYAAPNIIQDDRRIRP